MLTSLVSVRSHSSATRRLPSTLVASRAASEPRTRWAACTTTSTSARQPRVPTSRTSTTGPAAAGSRPRCPRDSLTSARAAITPATAEPMNPVAPSTRTSITTRTPPRRRRARHPGCTITAVPPSRRSTADSHVGADLGVLVEACLDRAWRTSERVWRRSGPARPPRRRASGQVVGRVVEAPGWSVSTGEAQVGPGGLGQPAARRTPRPADLARGHALSARPVLHGGDGGAHAPVDRRGHQGSGVPCTRPNTSPRWRNLQADLHAPEGTSRHHHVVAGEVEVNLTS